MPFIHGYKQGFEIEKGAQTVRRSCLNCGNDAEFVLCSSKHGPGVGVPVVRLFTQKAVLAAKAYYLICPICESAVKVEREQAKLLKAGTS